MSIIDNAMLFLRVVQAGSFTRAASQLYSSKSQISRRIANLEQRLDTTLLRRTTKGLQLTEQGEQFYRDCLSIRANFEKATAQLKSHQVSVSGPISISAPISLGSLILGPLLAKFMASYPEIRFELDLSDNIVNLNQSHHDMAIRAAKHLPDSSLYARKLYTYDYVIAGSPDYFQQHGNIEKPDDLSSHRAITCITTSDNDLQHSWPLYIQAQRQLYPVNVIARVTHLWVQKKFAKEGLGLIRVPRYWVKKELDKGTLISVLDNYMCETSHLFAVYKHGRTMPAKISAFIDYLAQHLPTVLS